MYYCVHLSISNWSNIIVSNKSAIIVCSWSDIVTIALSFSMTTLWFTGTWVIVYVTKCSITVDIHGIGMVSIFKILEMKSRLMGWLRCYSCIGIYRTPEIKMNKYLQKYIKNEEKKKERNNQSKKKKKTKKQLKQHKTNTRRKNNTKTSAFNCCCLCPSVHIFWFQINQLNQEKSENTKYTISSRRRADFESTIGTTFVVNRRRAVFESTIGTIICCKS